MQTVDGHASLFTFATSAHFCAVARRRHRTRLDESLAQFGEVEVGCCKDEATCRRSASERDANSWFSNNSCSSWFRASSCFLASSCSFRNNSCSSCFLASSWFGASSWFCSHSCSSCSFRNHSCSFRAPALTRFGEGGFVGRDRGRRGRVGAPTLRRALRLLLTRALSGSAHLLPTSGCLVRFDVVAARCCVDVALCDVMTHRRARADRAGCGSLRS